jgi:hypothetical protein
MFAAGGGGAGVLLAPSFFRGRVHALDFQLRRQRTILAVGDPYLNQSTNFTNQFKNEDIYGDPHTSNNDNPTGSRPREQSPPLADSDYGPLTDATRNFTYDPGDFYNPNPELNTTRPAGLPAPEPPGRSIPFVDDEPAIEKVGGSVTVVDGWLYITYRNGYIVAYSSNTTTGSGTPLNPPFWSNPNPPGQNPGGTSGNLVQAPISIRLLEPPVGTAPTANQNFRDAGTLDQSVMFDWGETAYVQIDFGDSGNLKPAQSVDPNSGTWGGQIDAAILQQPVQVLIRNSSNRPVQQLPGQNQSVRPTIDPNTKHIIAIVPLFAGIPSPTDPLTPGTPLLWERDPAGFNGEWTYEIQVTQPGLQWRWPDDLKTQTFSGKANPAKQHYWQTEPSSGANRFPTTAGRRDAQLAGLGRAGCSRHGRDHVHGVRVRAAHQLP